MPNRQLVELPDLAAPPGTPLGLDTAQFVYGVLPTPRALAAIQPSEFAPRRGE
jgi:hypothetical protein